jgi:hypothetical protein
MRAIDSFPGVVPSMDQRAELQNRFVMRFHFGSPPTPIPEQQLNAIETELNTKLPEAYREFMMRHGEIYTPGILDSIVAKEIDHPDVQNFLSPREVMDGTRAYWSGGMPDDVIGIASDCMGNMIGFRRHPMSSDDQPMVFFDHDFLDVHVISSSFDELLQWYLDNL